MTLSGVVVHVTYSLIVLHLHHLPCSYSFQLCCAGYGCTVQYDDKDLPKPKCPDRLEVSYDLYTRGNWDKPETVTKDAIPSKFKGYRSKTIFLLHGYLQTKHDLWLKEVKDVLLKEGDFNVIVVGWGRGAMLLNYAQAAANTYGVGLGVKAVSELMLKVATPRTALWCVGFSLGAHACGNAGLQVKFGRVTGLDPAGPMWAKFDRGLSKASASLVDVIHTDGRGLIPALTFYGTLKPMGHADFYPNGGSRQPGCITKKTIHDTTSNRINKMHQKHEQPDKLACSHVRSISYFYHSISSNCFIARNKCANPDNVTKNCPGCRSTCMGYAANASSQGLYFVPVQGTSPFCMSQTIN